MTPDISAVITFFQDRGILLIFKVLFLILLGVFILYCFIVVNRIKTLNRTLYMNSAHASATVQVAAVVLLFAAISLFIITIVIV